METIELDHQAVRTLAKRIGLRVNREIKHTEILDDIASVIGMRGDALMHALKQQKASEAPTVNPEVNLANRQEFVEKLDWHLHHAMDDYTVLVGTIELYSYDQVVSVFGQELAKKHLEAFAETIRPHLMFSDKTYAHLDGKHFLVAWPALDSEVDVERRVKTTIRRQDQRLKSHLEKLGVSEIGVPFGYTMGLWVDRSSCIDVPHAIDTSKNIANKLARVRERYPYMHQYRTEYSIHL